MRKQILIISIFLTSLLFSDGKDKIALVLSGGGAKGMAQIPIIEMIDSLNIPIDYVVGTSIGSINGAMYAMGYSSEEIKYYAYKTDWDFVFSNKKQRTHLFYFQKNDLDKYQIEFRLNGIKPVAPIALANGHSSYMNINNKTKNYEHISSFDKLLIPFRCNAVNLLNGKEIIFNNGSLSNALRASSSIPSVFTPVIHDSLLLVDGGVINNLPIDIAKDLGADIIIGVNVSPINKTQSEIENIFDVLTQSILVNGYQKRINNRKIADIIIEPNVKSYQTINFEKEILNELYKNGKKAAYENLDALMQIKKSIKVASNKIKISSINGNLLNISDIIINSSNVQYEDLFENTELPKTITKDYLTNKIIELRNSNQYTNLNYHFIKNANSKLTLVINIEKIPQIFINDIVVKNNKILNDIFIQDLLNLKKGTVLNINELRENIDRAYNLELFNSIRYDIDRNKIIITVVEAPFHTMKLSSGWNNYHKLIGNVKFSLFNKPIKKFKFTNEIRFGNTIKENNIHMYYIGNYDYKSQIIPTIKYSNKKNDVLYMTPLNAQNEITISNKNYSVNAIIPLTNFGFIDLGINKQKNKYTNIDNTINEKLTYYNITLNIDQIDNILYPAKGYKYNLYIEQPVKEYSYYLYKFNFDHFLKINRKNNLKFYGDFMLSDLDQLSSDELIIKSINYIPFDRTLSFSEYDLYASELISYGIEYNYSYKNSTTFRILLNNINTITLKYNNAIDQKNIYGYGIGLRIKSILGPINFLWTNSDKGLFNIGKKESYFFSLGVNL